MKIKSFEQTLLTKTFVKKIVIDYNDFNNYNFYELAHALVLSNI